MFFASMTTSTVVASVRIISGITKPPVGSDGTGTPPTLTTRIVGAGVTGRKTWKGEAKTVVGLEVPVN